MEDSYLSYPSMKVIVSLKHILIQNWYVYKFRVNFIDITIHQALM